jgi:hypothetical protein
MRKQSSAVSLSRFGPGKFRVEAVGSGPQLTRIIAIKSKIFGGGGIENTITPPKKIIISRILNLY